MLNRSPQACNPTPAPIPAFNYMDPSSKSGIRLSPPHCDSRSSSENIRSDAGTPPPKSILEYQNIQQQCDIKLLKELQMRRQHVNFQFKSNETEKENQCKHDDVQKIIVAAAAAGKKRDLERFFTPSKQQQRFAPIKKNNGHHNNSNNNNIHNQKQYYNIIENENIRSKSPLIYRYSKNKLQQQQKLATKYYLLPMQDIIKSASRTRNSKSSSSGGGSSKQSISPTSTQNSLDSIITTFNATNNNKCADFHQQETAGSYLGPFNFRQLLRPTQGPTESLRKRKHPISTTQSPPPLQRGKNN